MAQQDKYIKWIPLEEAFPVIRRITPDGVQHVVTETGVVLSTESPKNPTLDIGNPLTQPSIGSESAFVMDIAIGAVYPGRRSDGLKADRESNSVA